MTSVKPQVNLRNIVLSMLIEVEDGKKSHLVLKNYLDNYRFLDKQQRAFISVLFRGSIERKIELEYILNQFSKTPTAKMKKVIKWILVLSAYQLKYMDSVPVSAVCNEAVKLTNKRKMSGLKGFVNGVLRNITRNIDNIHYPDDSLDCISVKYSIPKWIVEMWEEQYGEERTVKMLESLYSPHSVTVRCNTSKADAADIIKNLKYHGVEVKQSELYKNALYIKGFDSLENLDAFQAGLITVQDESSMMVGLASGVKNNNYVIDVCAAPGGKSLHISDLMNGTGCVEARDLTEYKVGLIQENIKRIGIKNIKIKVMDASVLDEDSIERADIVIADLPCSGLGVIGKKSDIKYNVTKEQIDQLVLLQRSILRVVGRYVKPGGTLVFSTCTVNKFENDDNVRWIEENLPFRLKDFGDEVPKQLQSKKGCLQIFTGDYGMDGFFISTFEKIKG
ncbi:MAG: 16S rRNA (cytosine(967)-C(5))-methyltransferase RsmB [Eubacterium sp.]|jgi:16S rRNA (cytosine967-C5)-methyltransferase|nr:16S rRNA (cytosine(967)-C(5))-methyltransferase RsmB [Eubacterium sp.]